MGFSDKMITFKLDWSFTGLFSLLTTFAFLHYSHFCVSTLDIGLFVGSSIIAGVSVTDLLVLEMATLP